MHKLKQRWLILWILLLANCLIFVQSSFSQDEKYPRGAQYYLGTDDQLLIKVNVWGFVAKPGQYLVPSGTDLVSLISFAGGPIEGAKLSKIKIIRPHNTRTKKSDDAKAVIVVDVNKFIKTGDPKVIPVLKPDDTIVISGTKWYHFSKALEVITKVGYLVQIYAFIWYYTKK
ncbi:hypothetical protein B6D60_03990 [candidate division KSB1 bacterium 4484_87]|nr:MAG: hypothetical protein B6D60_03990 [candidate division KSB1 bacterium 4484_87]